MHPNIEIKPTPGRDVDTAEAVVEVTERCWNPSLPPPLISSFSRMSLAAAKVLRPQWPRGCIVHEIPDDWPVVLQVTLMLLAADFLRYWLHVTAHRYEPLWRLHARRRKPWLRERLLSYFRTGVNDT